MLPSMKPAITLGKVTLTQRSPGGQITITVTLRSGQAVSVQVEAAQLEAWALRQARAQI